MDCLFCKIIKGELPAVKVYEDEKILAFLDIHPVNFGHTLVVPKEHYENLLETPEEILTLLIQATKKIAAAVLKGVGAPAFNLGVNVGAEAGQVIPHVHFHVMPRQSGDGYKLWGHRDYAAGEMEETGKKISAAL